MPNSNCLEGKRCPRCGQADKILVMAAVTAAVTDDGADLDTNPIRGTNDVEYDGASRAQCPECGYQGTWGDFDCLPEKGICLWALHSGQNPQGLGIQAHPCGDAELYHELRVGVYKKDDCLADILVGLTEAGEIRVLISAGNDASTQKIAVYPQRELHEAIDPTWE